MISFKRIADDHKRYGVYINGELQATILLNKTRAIKMYKDIRNMLIPYDTPRYAIDIKNVQDGLEIAVWTQETDRSVFKKSLWFVDYEVN